MRQLYCVFRFVGFSIISILLLINYSCTSYNQKKPQTLFVSASEDIDSLKYKDAELSLLDFLKYSNEPANDTTAMVWIYLSEVYFQFDSMEASKYYLQLAEEYYSNNGNDLDYLRTKITLAEYYTLDLCDKKGTQLLDSIGTKVLALKNPELETRYYLLKDELFYLEYGYYSDSILHHINGGDSILRDVSLQVSLRLQQTKHDILIWEFKKAYDNLVIIDSITKSVNKKDLLIKKDFVWEMYYHDISENLMADSVSFAIQRSFGKSITTRQQFDVNYRLVVSYLRQHHYLKVDSLLTILKRCHMNDSVSNKKFQIENLYLNYLVSSGSYNLLNDQIETYLSDYNSEEYPLCNARIKLIWGNSFIKERNYYKADELLIGLQNEKRFKRLRFNALLRRVENAKLERNYNKILDLLDTMSHEEYLENDKRTYFFLHSYLGSTYSKLNKFDEAFAEYLKILEYSKANNSRHFEAVTYSNMGHVMGLMGNPDDLLLNSQLAISIFEKQKNNNYLGKIYAGLGLFFKRRNDLEKANKYILRSLDYKELVRSISGDEVKKSLLDKEFALYCGVQRNYQILNNYEGSIIVGERAKAKWMEEMLGVDGLISEVPQIEEIQNSLSDSGSILMFYNHLYSKTFSILITKDSIEIERLDNFLFVTDILKDKEFRSYCSRNLEEDKNTLLNRWKGNKSGLDFYIAKVVFRTYISYFRELIQIPFPSGIESALMKKVSKRLYQFLILPFEPDILKVNNVRIIPDGYLGYLPFEVLINSDEMYFVESHDISYVQSLSVLSHLQRRDYTHERKDIAILGFENFYSDIEDHAVTASVIEIQNNWPDLRGLNDEIKVVNSIFDDVVLYSDRSISKGKIIELSENGEFEDYKIFHISTHALFVPLKPNLTSLVIPDSDNKSVDYLSFKDICKLNIKSDLVILSACETGIGDDYSGEGISGLAQAFVIAGANGMLTTMWKISDQNSSMFIKEFYETVTDETDNYLNTINILKRRMIGGELNEVYKHPYYWAGFTYYGK